MTRRFVCAAVATIGLTGFMTIADAQQRPASRPDPLTGNWMLDPGKTIAWGGEENTTFEYVTLEVKDGVLYREVEAGMGLADANGIMQHRKNRTTVKYNEFDQKKAQLTNISVFGNNRPPMSSSDSPNHVVTLTVDEFTHIVFNKANISYIRHVVPNLKDYVFISFNNDGKIMMHRWFNRIKKAGDQNIPATFAGTK